MGSFTALYLELRGPIYRFLRRMGCDQATAEELTQESFIQALLGMSRYRGEASMRTWLFGIARNLYLKHVRDAKRKAVAVLTSAPDPQVETEARLQRDWLGQALAELPEAQRTALVLREYEGLSFGQIGAVMDRSEVWCRVTCFRARQQLKEAYLRQSGGER